MLKLSETQQTSKIFFIAREQKFLFQRHYNAEAEVSLSYYLSNRKRFPCLHILI